MNTKHNIRKYVINGVTLEFVRNGVSKTKCMVINVYFKCSPSEKKNLWRDLVLKKAFLEENVWCVMGDFNSSCFLFERAGGDSSVQLGIRSMLNFVISSLMELWDLPLIGRNFTWFQPKGRLASRLDRILISEDWREYWRTTSQWALHRDVLITPRSFSSIPTSFRD